MKRSFSILILVLSTVLLASCGGGGGGSTLQTPAANLAGTWSYTSTEGTNTCGDSVGTITSDSALITQATGSNNFTFTVASSNYQASGIISGTTISITETNAPSGGGYIDSTINVTLDTLNMSLSGTSNWTYKSSSGGPAVCSGQSSIVATTGPA